MKMIFKFLKKKILYRLLTIKNRLKNFIFRHYKNFAIYTR